MPANFFNKINNEDNDDLENNNINNETDTGDSECELKINKYMNYFEKEKKVGNYDIIEKFKVQELLNK